MSDTSERRKTTQRVVPFLLEDDMMQYRPGLYLVTSAVVRHSGAPFFGGFS